MVTANEASAEPDEYQFSVAPCSARLRLYSCCSEQFLLMDTLIDVLFSPAAKLTDAGGVQKSSSLDRVSICSTSTP